MFKVGERVWVEGTITISLPDRPFVQVVVDGFALTVPKGIIHPALDLAALREAVEGLRVKHDWPHCLSLAVGPDPNPPCTCGADEHNARVDEVMRMLGC